MELDYKDEVRVRALELAIKHAVTKRGYSSGMMSGGQSREISIGEVVNDATQIETYIHNGSSEDTK